MTEVEVEGQSKGESQSKGGDQSKGGNQSKGGDMEVDKPHEEVEKENQTPNKKRAKKSIVHRKKKRYTKKEVATNAEFVKSN